jgi:GNAT superfamily N-acetyltransferase
MPPDELSCRDVAEVELAEAVRLLCILNPDTEPAEIRRRLGSIMADHPHYRLHGVWDGGRLLGVAGSWIGTRIWCGRYLEIDNLVVDPEARSSGAGSRLIKHLEDIARISGCEMLILDAYTGNHASHRLYHRLGLEIWGFHFVKPLANPQFLKKCRDVEQKSSDCS